LLPVGIHDCNLAEIEAAFVHNNQRELVWRGFGQYLELIRSVPGLNVVYVDGGFVTDKVHPKDLDVIIEYRDGKTRFRLKETYWFLRLRDRVWNRHLVDILDCLLNEPSPNMKDFFQLLRPEEAVQRGLPAGSQKGILRISLR
jgi:hypothetical protein